MFEKEVLTLEWRNPKKSAKIKKNIWRGGRAAEGAPLLREYAVYPVSRVRIPLSPPLTTEHQTI